MKGRVFRDPVHGLISIDDEDAALCGVLDTLAVQRLRHIRQMGLAWYVYPGAEHSRFGHALGTFHVATRVARSIGLSSRERRLLQVAALLHDVGHGPMSHAWEEVFPHFHHEAWGAKLIRQDQELREAIETFEPGLVDDLLSLWQGAPPHHHLKKLVSSELDVDRLDYLLRDSHYSGARYAAFDLDWILHAIRLKEIDGEPDIVVDYRRGMYAVEQYLFSRAYMYSQVYHHKTVRSVECLFLGLVMRFRDLLAAGHQLDAPPALLTLARGESPSVEDFLQLSDHSVFSAIQRWSRGQDDPLAQLAQRMRRRRLLKTLDLGDVDAGHVNNVAAEVGAASLGKHWHYFVHVDITGETKAGGPTDLLVVGHPRHGTLPMGALLERLPTRTRTVRVVAPPEILSAVKHALS